MLYCITTASKEELSTGDLDSFLHSVENQNTKVVLVLRGVSDQEANHYLANSNVCAVLRVPLGGISTVRNLGLRYLEQVDVANDDIISFPDDDCRYPTGLVTKVNYEFQGTNAELIVGSYGEKGIEDGESVHLTTEDAAFRSSSVALFVRWSLIRRIGGFNEALGVGSGVFSYGEDNDFALRAFRASSLSLRNESLRVWHLEERPTTGRNPKGYLTSCVLNLRVKGVVRIVIRGIFSSLLQDLRSFPRPLPHLRFMTLSLSPSKLRRAKVNRLAAVSMFDLEP